MESMIVDTYLPCGDEPYMNKRQLDYFKNRLILKKMELIRKINQNMDKVKSLKSNHPDPVDRSNFHMDIDRELRTNERYGGVVEQIDNALERIKLGSFGYCEITGNEIGLKRLETLPFTNMSMEALEERERAYTHSPVHSNNDLFFLY